MPATKRRWKDRQGVAHEAWAASFYDDADKRHRKAGFRTKKDAEIWETEERLGLATAARTHVQVGDELTVAALCQKWLDAISAGHGERQAVEHQSWRDYDISVRLHIAPRIGDKMLTKITAPVVVEFRKRLLQESSRSKAQRVLKHLRQALNFAVESGYIQANPALAVRIAPDKREEKKPKVPSREEMGRILTELDRLVADDEKHWLCFATLFYLLQGTGLRISEARGLLWSAVDLKRGLLHVRQRLDKDNIAGSPKSAAAARMVVLDTNLVARLERWKKAALESKGGFVFVNSRGKSWAHSNLYQLFWKPLCVSLDLVTVTGAARYAFHSARHFRASTLIASGANLKELMGEIGHTSSAMTLDLYGHLFPEDLDRRRERAERIAKDLVTQKSQETTSD